MRLVDRIHHTLAAELGWTAAGDGDGAAAAVVARWEALLARDDVPAAWRRHPRLLRTMLARSGVDDDDDDEGARRRRRRQRLRTVPRPRTVPIARDNRQRLTLAEAVARLDGVAGAGDFLGRWAATGRPWCPYTVHALRDALSSPPSSSGDALREWLGAADGPALRGELRRWAREHGWNAAMHDGVRAALWRACGHPEVDPRGTFHSHRQYVARAFLEAHPALWDLPVEAALRLARLPDPQDVPHLCLFLQDVVRRRLVRLPPHRDPRRACVSVCRRALWFLRLVEAGAPPPQQPGTAAATWRGDWLPASLDRDGLLDVAARALAAYNRSDRPRRRKRSTPTVTDARRVLLGFLHGCVATGVFEPRVPANAVLEPHALDRRLLALEASDPARYRAHPAPPELVDRPGLATADVDALRTACRTPRERAFLALVSTTGVRSCAVAWARVGDVWDAARGEVRHRVGLREKNSDVRHLTPCPELREALREHVLTSRPRALAPGQRARRRTAMQAPSDCDDLLLFPGRRRPRVPSPCVARGMLATLCRRAGLARVYTPHQFRHYVVNELMRQGNRIECVSKWLGHRSAEVTYRHYWTEDAAGLLVVRPPPPAPTGDGASSDGGDDRLYEALQAKVEEVETLRRLLLGAA